MSDYLLLTKRCPYKLYRKPTLFLHYHSASLYTAFLSEQQETHWLTSAVTASLGFGLLISPSIYPQSYKLKQVQSLSSPGAPITCFFKSLCLSVLTTPSSHALIPLYSLLDLDSGLQKYLNLQFLVFGCQLTIQTH